MRVAAAVLGSVAPGAGGIADGSAAGAWEADHACACVAVEESGVLQGLKVEAAAAAARVVALGI